MRAEKHIEAEAITREKGSREIRNRDRSNDDCWDGVTKRLGREGFSRGAQLDLGGRPEREVPTKRNPWEENFTPLRKKRAQILKEVMNTQIIKRPPPSPRPMGSEAGLWCEYHHTQGHDTDNCRTLKMHIEKLIQEGHLGRYVQGRGETTMTKGLLPVKIRVDLRSEVVERRSLRTRRLREDTKGTTEARSTP